MFGWMFLAPIALVALLACTLPAAPPPAGGGASARSTPAQSTDPILVLAASDLQFALPEIAALFESEAGRKLTLMFGSTGNLSQQIENGAPADLFFAANESFIDDLGRKGLLVDGSRQVYAVGRIVLVGSRDFATEVRTLQDLLRPEVRRIGIANPEHAPYGLAAQQALQTVGVWESLEPKLVFGENISQTFQFVQTGNADAGIVALSVALGVPGTVYTLLDDSGHEPLVQAAAAIGRSKDAPAAQAFLRFVNGPQGRPVMKRFGFVLPNEP